MKYKDWLNEWLKNYIKPSSKTRTYQRYYIIVEKHLKDGLGEYDLDELTAIVIQRYVTELMQSGNKVTYKGLSVNSVNGIITVIKSTLKLAFLLGLCKEYVGDKIKRPKAQSKMVECFSFAEQKLIEQAAINDKRCKLYGVILCLYTGLRIGELLALEWSDIDFNKGVLTVNKACYDGKDENGKACVIIDTPKTATSRREIPLPKQLISGLKELKKKCKSNNVIFNNNGDAISIRSYQRTFELLLKKLHISRKGFHSLRHTFATRALECGMDVKTLSEILGHKNPTITLNRYVHSMLEHKREMMNRVGKILIDK